MQAQGFNRKTVIQMFLLLAAFCFLGRLILASSCFNSYDTYWYRDWAFDINQNGLFSVYARAQDISLDYPPVYLILLYFTGKGYELFGQGCAPFLQMFLLKFWPVLFDTFCACAFFYIFFKKDMPNVAVSASMLWALNPAVLFGTCVWGQTDQIMCFLLILSFYYLQENRYITACVLFAVAGLTKFQCLFFLPVFVVHLIWRNKPKQWLKGFAAAALTVAAVFMPFIIGAKDASLFFKVYSGSAGEYKYFTLNAFNLYGALDLNWVPEKGRFFLGISASAWGYIVLFGSFIGVGALYAFAKRKCPWVGGMLLMQCIFMLATRMHERYQLAVLPFALMAYFVNKYKPFLYIFVSLTVITLVNQAFVLLPVMSQRTLGVEMPWAKANVYNTSLIIFSLINVIIFAYSIYYSVKFLRGWEKIKQ